VLTAYPAYAGLVWDAQNAPMIGRPSDREIKIAITFRNSGPDVVTIVGFVPECDCTAVTVDKDVYKPGEAGSLLAVIKVSGGRGIRRTSLDVITKTNSDEMRQTVKLSYEIQAAVGTILKSSLCVEAKYLEGNKRCCGSPEGHILKRTAWQADRATCRST
jgi:hypothetical protein